MFSIIKVLVEEAKKKAEPRVEIADVRMTTKYGPAVVPPRPRPGRPTPYVIDPGMTTKYGPVVVPPRTKPGRPDMTTKYGPVVIERIIPINPTTTLYACPVIDMRDDKTKIVPGPVVGKRGGKGGR